MGGFFTRERFGRPQILAALMLLAFLAQCLWLVERGWQTGTVYPEEIYRLERGTALWKHRALPVAAPDLEKELDSLAAGRPTQPMPGRPGLEHDGYDANHSLSLVSDRISSAGAESSTAPTRKYPRDCIAWLRRPILFSVCLLGASLWYVSRRLFGNAGGYIALALYCFSPGIVRSAAIWSAEPEIGAAWGAFGAIFTAIAVAHTLYAPREVILWNWRRIVLLGLSLALAVGSQFPLIVVLPVALAFMLYVAPTRRMAALAIWAVACGIGALLLYASYFFHAGEFWRELRHASFFPVSWRAFTMARAYHQVLAQLGQSSPALVLALPVALITYFFWPRARYFGNTAPLLVAVLFLILGSGYTALSRTRFSAHGDSIPVRLRGRNRCGPAGNPLPATGPGRGLGLAGSQCRMASVGTGPRWTRVTDVTSLFVNHLASTWHTLGSGSANACFSEMQSWKVKRNQCGCGRF